MTPTPSHQTPPSITVYVPVKAWERFPTKEFVNYFLLKEGNVHTVACFTKKFGWEFIFNGKISTSPLEYEWLEPQTLPDFDYLKELSQDKTRLPEVVLGEFEQYMNNFK